MSAKHESLNLLDVSVPVLRGVFSQGLEEMMPSRAVRLRSAYEEWRGAVDADDAVLERLHTAWIDEVLPTALSAGDQLLQGGKAVPTATLVVCVANDEVIDPLVKGWTFYSPPNEPLRIDLPALSTLEGLTMEANGDARETLGFELPESGLGEAPFEVFKKFYRIYPHFSRVEL